MVHLRGRWTGIRGLRFLRPTLVAGDHQVLATLEHKPWAPIEGSSWVAEFPWAGDERELAGASLEVAPRVLVPVGAEARRVGLRSNRPQEQRDPVLKPSPASTRADGDLEHLRPRPLEPLPAVAAVVPPVEDAVAVPEPAAEVVTDRDPAPAPAVDAPPATSARSDDPDPVTAGSDARPQPDDHRTELIRELKRDLRAVESARDAEARESRSTAASLQRARDQLEEAVRDREAAVRTRDRLDEQREEAMAAARAAERRAREEVAAAQRERDTAAGQRDEARQQAATLKAQRDEALLAHRSLQQLLDAERAQRGREAGPAPAAPAPRRSGPADPPAPAAVVSGDTTDLVDDDDDDDAPLGIRAVPAARAVPADLLGAREGGKPALGGFDRWVLRVLALATATCFLLLLVMLLSIFI
ncbi:hypothetical protein DSM112329_03189 [Paraconexibacter sp. AEG42_29]|uniref:Uncharacterized protein n=1 Tax=Paraconexibacter sp. AEG42_29 TaxID=2997339 RepID=A0AAU7AX74_9ACTN